MKNTIYSLLLALILVACGTDKRHFEIDGRLLNLNQGEFYVYSPDGALDGIDTIKVQAGRFTYSVECPEEMTLMIVFPNFTEQPVFASPGKSVDIKGDASHLKELTVKGTKANELMNSLRERIANASPDEMREAAQQFVEDNPKSIVSEYAVRRFFMQTDKPDFDKAKTLLGKMLKEQPDNNRLKAMLNLVNSRTTPPIGRSVPKFATYDINGKTVSNATLSEAPNTVVVAWATWNYNSIAMLRNLTMRQNESNGNVKVVGVCLDYSRSQCRHTLQLQAIENATVVCDGKAVEGEMFNRLGMSNVPDNVLIKNGKVVATGLTLDALNKQLSTDKN